MAAGAVHAGQVQGGAHAAKPFEIPDELLHAPKQTSKLRFALMILLVIVLLLIFGIPSGLRGLGAWRGKGIPAAFSWTSPVHGKIEVNELDLQLAYRDFSQAFQVDFLVYSSLGVTEKFDARGTARLLVLDQLAQDAGLVVTDSDLRDHLKSYLDTLRMPFDDYRRRVQQFGFDVAKVEETIRRALRIGRFLEISGYAAAVPDPAEIEKMWEREHVEFAFEYAALTPADMKETARVALPDEAGLRAWFDGLDEVAKKELETPEKRRADFAIFKSIEETPAAALVAAFPPEPPAEGQPPPSADELAQDYYNRVFHRRFVKFVDDAPEGHVHHDHDKPKRTEFQPFEEVKERCLAEAPVYFALQRWLQALQGRKAAGETIDLAAEAAQYGLQFRALEKPLTREELTADPELDDSQIASAVFEAAPDGGFHFVPVATKNALVISRAIERVEPVLPPFEEIQDKVVEKWIEPKAEELALSRLQSVWIGFEEFEPPVKEDELMPPEPEGKVHRHATADQFQQGLANAMLTVQKRDFLDRGAPADSDPLFEEPAHKYLVTRFDLYQMDEGEVAEPQMARDKSAAYIVRVAGRREVPIDRMSKTQYDRYKTNARDLAVEERALKFDIPFLEKNYGLVLRKAKEEEAGEKEASASEPKSAGASETKAEANPPAATPITPLEQPDAPGKEQPGEQQSTGEAPADTGEAAGEPETPKQE